MASEFDKKLNERFDHASLEELMPEFNTNSEWNRIEEKLPKKRKIVPVLWLSHAAVLAVGLLVSWVLMKQWMGNDANIQPQPVVVYKNTDTPAKAIPAIEPAIKEETLTVSKTTAPPKVREKKITPQQAITKIPETIAEAEQQAPQVAVQEQEQPVMPKPEAVVAARPKRNVQAVHMLDINNEDKQIMIEGSDYKLQYKDPIARLLSPGRLPDHGNGNPDKPLLIRGFFEK